MKKTHDRSISGKEHHDPPFQSPPPQVRASHGTFQNSLGFSPREDQLIEVKSGPEFTINLKNSDSQHINHFRDTFFKNASSLRNSSVVNGFTPNQPHANQYPAGMGVQTMTHSNSQHAHDPRFSMGESGANTPQFQNTQFSQTAPNNFTNLRRDEKYYPDESNMTQNQTQVRDNANVLEKLKVVHSNSDPRSMDSQGRKSRSGVSSLSNGVQHHLGESLRRYGQEPVRMRSSGLRASRGQDMHMNGSVPKNVRFEESLKGSGVHVKDSRLPRSVLRPSSPETMHIVNEKRVVHTTNIPGNIQNSQRVTLIPKRDQYITRGRTKIISVSPEHSSTHRVRVTSSNPRSQSRSPSLSKRLISGMPVAMRSSQNRSTSPVHRITLSGNTKPVPRASRRMTSYQTESVNPQRWLSKGRDSTRHYPMIVLNDSRLSNSSRKISGNALIANSVQRIRHERSSVRRERDFVRESSPRIVEQLGHERYENSNNLSTRARGGVRLGHQVGEEPVYQGFSRTGKVTNPSLFKRSVPVDKIVAKYMGEDQMNEEGVVQRHLLSGNHLVKEAESLIANSKDVKTEVLAKPEKVSFKTRVLGALKTKFGEKKREGGKGGKKTGVLDW